MKQLAYNDEIQRKMKRQIRKVARRKGSIRDGDVILPRHISLFYCRNSAC